MGISQAKVENFICLTINSINIILYILVFTASIVKSIDASLGIIIQCVYCCIMSIFLIINECRTFALAQIYFGFLGVHQGRGLLLLFLGCLVMCDKAFNVIVSILDFTMGLAYLILSFLPQMPPPNPLSIHWQHRQDFWAEGLDLPAPSTRSSKLLTPTTPAFPHPSLWHPSSPYYYTKHTTTSALQNYYFQPLQQSQQSQQPNDSDITVPSNNNGNDKSQCHQYY